jgi:hypothetical protein
MGTCSSVDFLTQVATLEGLSCGYKHVLGKVNGDGRFGRNDRDGRSYKRSTEKTAGKMETDSSWLVRTWRAGQVEHDRRVDRSKVENPLTEGGLDSEISKRWRQQVWENVSAPAS